MRDKEILEKVKKIFDKAIHTKITTGWRLKGNLLREKYNLLNNEDFSGPYDLTDKNKNLDKDCDRELIYLSFYIKGLKKGKKILERTISDPVSNEAQYMNYCWNCKTKIDSRVNDRCGRCKWYICENCRSCEYRCSQQTLKQIIENIDFEE